MPTKPANDNKGKAATIRKVVKKTVTVGGKRVILTSKADGATTAAPAPELEWRLQAEAVRQLKTLDGYDTTGDNGFTFAGDFAAGKRQAAKARATGLTPGEADLRIYFSRGRILHMELKAEKTPVSADQKKRHALLRALGHDVIVIRASTADEMARLVCAAVNVRLANETRGAPRLIEPQTMQPTSE